MLLSNFKFSGLLTIYELSFQTSKIGNTWQSHVVLVELVSKELNHFGVIAGLFRQIGGHSSTFVRANLLFLKTFQYKND